MNLSRNDARARPTSGHFGLWWIPCGIASQKFTYPHLDACAGTFSYGRKVTNKNWPNYRCMVNAMCTFKIHTLEQTYIKLGRNLMYYSMSAWTCLNVMISSLAQQKLLVGSTWLSLPSRVNSQSCIHTTLLSELGIMPQHYINSNLMYYCMFASNCLNSWWLVYQQQN